MAAAAYLYPAEQITEDDREQLILDHLPQVRLIARKIHERLPETASFEDLISAGTLGLIAAIDNFDHRQNVKLKTYAEFRIRGAILDSLRELDWAPRQKRRQARDLEAAIARLEQKLGRSPEEGEIARELQISLDEYRQQLTEMEGLNIGEIDFQSDPSGDGRQGESRQVKYAAADGGDSPALHLERSELENLVANSIDRIPRVEKTVLSLYFFEELTLKEIADMMDLHLSRVSQIKSQAILRLRSTIAKRWPGVRS